MGQGCSQSVSDKDVDGCPAPPCEDVCVECVDVAEDATESQEVVDAAVLTDPEPDTSTFIQEVCTNQFDDDGDGLTDCADPVCKGAKACAEKECSDGKDNDQDGYIDCHDPDCEYVDVCHPETCASFYECLAVMGCQCALGDDCPVKDTPEYQECQKKCYMSNNCRANCMSALSIVTQEKIVDLQQCLFEDCTAQSWGDCFQGDCLDEFANCYLAGEFTCKEFFYECIFSCGGNPNCYGQCYADLSSQGYIDFVSWNQCRLEMCDANSDYVADSGACWNIAGMYGCLEVSGGCIPSSTEGTCAGLEACVLHCESFNDAACLASCVEGAGIPGDAKAVVSDLFECVIATCTGPPGPLTPICMEAAILGPCADQHAACAAH